VLDDRDDLPLAPMRRDDKRYENRIPDQGAILPQGIEQQCLSVCRYLVDEVDAQPEQVRGKLEFVAGQETETLFRQFD
jgi:hypothetical protein